MRKKYTHTRNIIFLTASVSKLSLQKYVYSNAYPYHWYANHNTRNCPNYCYYSQSIVLARESTKRCLLSPLSFFQLPSAGPRWLPISPGIGLRPVHLSQVCKAILVPSTFCARSPKPRDHLSSYEQKGGLLIFIFSLWSPLFIPLEFFLYAHHWRKTPYR